jgi:hypothetical protein
MTARLPPELARADVDAETGGQIDSSKLKGFPKSDKQI